LETQRDAAQKVLAVRVEFLTSVVADVSRRKLPFPASKASQRGLTSTATSIKLTPRRSQVLLSRTFHQTEMDFGVQKAPAQTGAFEVLSD
jgi:hypothetical protein